jgi:hypothetical protein
MTGCLVTASACYQNKIDKSNKQKYIKYEKNNSGG